MAAPATSTWAALGLAGRGLLASPTVVPLTAGTQTVAAVTVVALTVATWTQCTLTVAA